jgi:NitT/TauT family transport system substrate-binding protein
MRSAPNQTVSMPTQSPLAYLLLILCMAWPPPGFASQLLRVGTNVWPGYEPLYLAAEREDWRGELNIRLVEYPSATEVIRAFRNRTLEAAALTLDEVLTLRETGIPLRVVAVLDVSAGADVILAKPDIRRFADLEGRRIGVESTALGAYILTRALQMNDMSLADVEIAHLDVSAHLRAFRTGVVDAVATFEPVKTKLEGTGAHALFSSREIPGEIVDVLVVRVETLGRDRRRLREMLAGWFRALDYMERQPMAAARFTARRLKMTPQNIVASYDGIELPDVAESLRLLEQDLPHTLARLQDTLVDAGLLRERQPIDDLLDSSLIRR